MKTILEGHKQFLDQTAPESLESLREGQSPEVLFICCSDSRVNPGKTLRVNFGEIFEVQNAGNIVPPSCATTGGEAATIEYAVKALKVKHAVICGHTHCGAMGGLMSPDSLQSLPRVAEWLEHARDTKRAVEKLNLGEDDDPVDAAIKQNVLVQMANLESYVFVDEAVKNGSLTIHGWVYDIGSGRVVAYDSESGEFKPLVEE